MAIELTAFDPDNNGIGIYYEQYLSNKFAGFDAVSGTLSTDAAQSQYAFIGPDGGSIIFHAAGSWTVDSETGVVSGTIDMVTFGQQTSIADDGTFSQSLEMRVSNLAISDQATLDKVLADASDGKLWSLNDALNTDTFPVRGSSSKDSLYGGSQGDIIRGGAGDDRLYGAWSYLKNDGDRLIGGDGNDQIIGSRGGDVIFGDDGDDRLRGMIGDDIVKGGAGNDHISGDRGDDKLWGESGDDYIHGGSGNDTLYGGAGNDELWGGWGIDRFVFEKGAGDDVIRDFRPGKAGKDLIVFDDVGLESFGDLMDHATEVSGGVMITYDEGSLFLAQVQLSQLDRHDFGFV